MLPTLQPLLVLKFYSCPLIQSKKGHRASEFYLLRMCQHGEPSHTATREYIHTYTHTHTHLVGSKSFRLYQLFKVNNFAIF
jgi:hypothetical protein